MSKETTAANDDWKTYSLTGDSANDGQSFKNADGMIVSTSIYGLEGDAEAVCEIPCIMIMVPRGRIRKDGDSSIQHIEAHTFVERSGKLIDVPEHYRNGTVMPTDRDDNDPEDKPYIFNRKFFGITPDDYGRTIVARCVVEQKILHDGTRYVFVCFYKLSDRDDDGNMRQPTHRFTTVNHPSKITNAENPAPVHIIEYSFIDFQTRKSGKVNGYECECGQITWTKRQHDEEKFGPYKCRACISQ